MMEQYTKDIVDVDFLYQKTDDENVVIHSNNKTIILENSFFDQNKSDFSSHFQKDHIPQEIQNSSITIGNTTLPLASVYGSNEVSITNNTLRIKADLLASGFFMLTRWEESVNKERDKHQRYPSQSSLAVKSGMHMRPLVDEYKEVFEASIEWMLGNIRLTARSNKVIATHDVDHYRFIQSKTQKFVKSSKAVLSGNKEILKAIQSKIDIYNRMDEFMDLAEKIDQKAFFFFLTGGKSEYDIQNKAKYVQESVKKVVERGHEIGIHPSYEFVDKVDILSKEKRKLEQLSGQKITNSRNHYLRPETPKIYKQLIANGIETDFTMGYADQIGFRAGVSSSYYGFDWKERKKLPLKIQPLHIMDVTLKDYLKISPEESIEEIQKLQEQVKKYNGEFCFLWHNSSFEINGWKDYESVLPVLYN